MGFVPFIKGKLPFTTVSQSYALEYGEATVKCTPMPYNKAQRVLLVDDLVATGGTMLAGVELISPRGGGSGDAAIFRIHTI